MQVTHRVELSISLVTTSVKVSLPFQVLGVRMCESDLHFPCVFLALCRYYTGTVYPSLPTYMLNMGRIKNGLLRHILINVIKKYIQGDPREPDVFKINNTQLFFK